MDVEIDEGPSSAVEVLLRDDADKRQRLHDGFKICLTLEEAYQSGRLRNRIAPRCYGALASDGMGIFILDLCDGVLNDWTELSDPERYAIAIMPKQLLSLKIMTSRTRPSPYWDTSWRPRTPEYCACS